jgi:hypothetical protein
MNRFLKIVAALAILYFVPKIIQHVMLPRPGTIGNDQVVTMVKEINSKLPKSLGSGTTLRKVEYQASSGLEFFYMLDESAHFDISQKDRVAGGFTTFVCQGPMKEFVKQGIAITFHTTYPDSGETKSFDTPVHAGQCT